MCLRTGNADRCASQVGVYFTEVDHGEKIKYVPRSVQIDLEDGVLNRVSLLSNRSVSRPIDVIADRAHGDKQSRFL